MESTDFLKVNITDINWDIDDGEEKPSDLKSEMNVLFKINDVVECLENNDSGDYKVNDEALSDFLSDYISDTAGFCHNGFNYTYEILKQKNLSHIHF